MDKSTTILMNNPSKRYLERVAYYSPRCIVFFTLTEFIFFRRLSVNMVLLGFAMGAGYCHYDLVNALSRIYRIKNSMFLEKLEEMENNLKSTIS
jgi:hypothetical protein